MAPALYLDHNAGSPLRPRALKAMLPWLERGAANPSSLHRDGQAARAALEAARARVAVRLGGSPEDWLFTSGATEACNLGLAGACAGGRAVLVGATEHPAVLETALALRAEGNPVEVLPVDGEGVVALPALEAALGRHPGALLALMAANNETGVRHPLDAVLARARRSGALFFCDLAQAAGKLILDARALDLDLAALSACKFGGPQGSGLLYVRPGLALSPRLRGGHQERGLRPGTENVAGAVGLAEALDEACEDLERRQAEWAAAVRVLERGLEGLAPGARVFGAGAPRVANTLCAGLPGVDRDLLLMRLDQLGLRASAGAACAAGASQPSHVLEAMAVPADLRGRQIRFSFGPGQGEAEARDALERLSRALEGLRASGAFQRGWRIN